MKTITIKQKKKLISFKWLVFSLIVIAVNNSEAQVQNNESLYIGDNGSVYLVSGSYYFGAGTGQTQTTRTPSVYGKLIFSSVASSSGASDSHYLDGYGRVITTTPFIIPIGQNGVYAPIEVTPSTAEAVDAAYFRSSPTVLSTMLDVSVASISNIEYWEIIGSNNASISLTWRSSSDLSNFVPSLVDLTIVGFDGAKWVEIPSSIDVTSILGGSSSISSGSISSLSSVDLTEYSYFSLGAKGDSCPPLVASSGTTKIWSGVWSPSTPTLSDSVIINAPYSGGSFACNSLVLNADVTLLDGQNIEIVNGVTGSGRIIMSSEASVVQRASGVNAPNIELTKKSRDVMHRFDYIYWGTPIAGNFISQIAGAQASTGSLANAFDLKYKYVSGAGGGWQNLTSIETGRGFITRIKSQAPFTNATNTDFINLKFTGVANNGDITVPITNNLASPNGGTSHVLLANPYPSAIDAEKFLTENADIDGVLYIWTAGTVNNGTGQLYTQADYIAYTLAGSVVPNAIPLTFNGKIASGQGFKVKSLSNAGTVTFTNCMRLTADNNQFYRWNQLNSTVSSRDSFKLNMTGSNAVFSQILVSYMPEATLGYDRMYDAGRNSVSTAQLFSFLEADGRRLAINARPIFTDTDIVQLGVSKNNTNSEIFTITIEQKEGVFNNGQNVYLHDKALELYHDFNNGGYTFSSNSDMLSDRFEIVYQTSTLNNPVFNTQNTVASINNEVLTIVATEGMKRIELFDIAGKHIDTYNVQSSKEFSAPFLHAEGFYITKIEFNSGVVVIQKLINSTNN